MSKRAMRLVTEEPAPQPVHEPLTLNWEGAAKRLGISSYSLKILVRDGDVRPIRVGTLVRFTVVELERWANEVTDATSRHGR